MHEDGVLGRQSRDQHRHVRAFELAFGFDEVQLFAQPRGALRREACQADPFAATLRRRQV